MASSTLLVGFWIADRRRHRGSRDFKKQNTWRGGSAFQADTLAKKHFVVLLGGRVSLLGGPCCGSWGRKEEGRGRALLFLLARSLACAPNAARPISHCRMRLLSSLPQHHPPSASFNELGDQGVMAVIDVMTTHPSLMSLGLASVDPTPLAWTSNSMRNPTPLSFLS